MSLSATAEGDEVVAPESSSPEGEDNHCFVHERCELFTLSQFWRFYDLCPESTKNCFWTMFHKCSEETHEKLNLPLSLQVWKDCTGESPQGMVIVLFDSVNGTVPTAMAVYEAKQEPMPGLWLSYLVSADARPPSVADRNIREWETEQGLLFHCMMRSLRYVYDKFEAAYRYQVHDRQEKLSKEDSKESKAEREERTREERRRLEEWRKRPHFISTNMYAPVGKDLSDTADWLRFLRSQGFRSLALQKWSQQRNMTKKESQNSIEHNFVTLYKKFH